MKVDILAFGAHPDDVELSASATLLRHLELGKTVGLVDLTRGELGTRGTPELRMAEAEDARQQMGASFRKNLYMADGFFRNSEENLLRIIQVLRTAKPEIVLANALEDRHIDHGKAAKLVADACFLSGLQKIETQDEAGNMQTRWRPKAVYHYIQDRDLVPDFVVDVTDFVAQKIELIRCFRSQFHDPNSKELETPLTGSDFFDLIKSKMKAMGRPANFAFAEGFNVNRIPGVNDLFDLV